MENERKGWHSRKSGEPLSAINAKAVIREMRIKAKGILDAIPFHEGKCGAIHETEILVVVLGSDFPCSLEV